MGIVVAYMGSTRQYCLYIYYSEQLKDTLNILTEGYLLADGFPFSLIIITMTLTVTGVHSIRSV